MDNVVDVVELEEKMKVMELENNNSQGRSMILVDIFRTDDAAPLFLVLTEYLSWRDLGNLEIAVVGDVILRGMYQEALSHHAFHYESRDEDGKLKYLSPSEIEWRMARGVKSTTMSVERCDSNMLERITRSEHGLNKVLRKFRTGNIDDAGLDILADGCKDLRDLDLSWCGSITDAGLASLAGGCKDLRKLNLHYCESITDAGLASLAVGCKDLRDLDLRSCERITDAGLASLAGGCKDLRDLSLHGCRSITDAGVASLRACGCRIDGR